MNSACHEQHLVPLQVLNAVYASIKRRAFSRKQTVKQKWASLLGAGLCGFIFWGAIGYIAFILGIVVFLLIRWKNLGVLQFRENCIFTAAWLYTALLVAASLVYGALYKRVFRHITVVQFFPSFPYNQQLLTITTTQGEIAQRDNFWKDRLPAKVPSPNLLTGVRIAGAISLLFLRDLELGYFLVLVGMLFLTDYYDGIIARTRNRETTFGKWADPIADWLLLCSVSLYLYWLHPSFGVTFLLMLIPQVCIVVFFTITFLLSGTTDLPRPVIWGRLKFSFYGVGTLLLLLGSTVAAQVCFSIGIAFAYLAFASYATRKYQEVYKESVFFGMLRLCLRSLRIRKELTSVL
ncbi:MAG: CDP-alcohol phosphatidyltransferase family protein [Patescibacteria group bacterium]